MKPSLSPTKVQRGVAEAARRDLITNEALRVCQSTDVGLFYWYGLLNWLARIAIDFLYRELTGQGSGVRNNSRRYFRLQMTLL